MKKRIVSVLLTAAMAVSILAGCGSGGSSQGSGSGGTSGDYPLIKIPYLVLGGNNSDEALVEEDLNEIMREKAQAEVDLIPIEWGNLSTQLNLMLSGGGENSVDLFSSTWYTSVSNLVANGQVMELDDLLESDGQTILEAYDGLEDYLDCGRIDGKLYGIPSIYAFCSEDFYQVQRDVSEAAGIDWSQVNDLDTLTDAMIKMKEVSPDSYFIPGSTDPYFVPKDIDYLGDTNYLGVLTDPTNSTTVENYYESDYFLNFLEHVKVWKENDLFSPDPLSSSEATLANLQYGVADGSLGYGWDTQISIDANCNNTGLDLVGGQIGDSVASTGEVTTYMWHMSAFCQEPEAAMRVLAVLYSDPEASQLVANGIEGREYTINDNGQMEYPEGQNLTTIGWSAASSAYWPNVTLCETWSYEPEDVYEVMAEKRENAKKSLALGFQFDSSSVTDQMTACANVVAQYYDPLMYGEVDIDETLPEFQQALKDAGIDDIIAEKQAQLDEWLASK